MTLQPAFRGVGIYLFLNDPLKPYAWVSVSFRCLFSDRIFQVGI